MNKKPLIMNNETYSNTSTMQKKFIYYKIKIQQYIENEKNRSSSSLSLKCHSVNHKTS